MANEINLNFTLTIIKGNLEYRQTKSWQADMAGKKGPVVGALTIPVAGTDIDLSELTTPSIAMLTNLDSTNFVEYGINSGGFLALGEILPGESYPIRFSRNLGVLHFKADTADVDTVIEIFES